MRLSVAILAQNFGIVLQVANVTKNYRTALAITGIVTAIATYHYVWIFNSLCDASNESSC